MVAGPSRARLPSGDHLVGLSGDGLRGADESLGARRCRTTYTKAHHHADCP